MSEIFIDHDCKVCSTYGNWINNKNNDMKINDQKDLSINEINLDTLVYKNQKDEWDWQQCDWIPVSYTHLTLPTIYSV